MKIAIVPFSDLAQSESVQVYNYFKAKGADITIYYWGNPKLPEGVKSIQMEVGDKLTGLDDFDLIVRGPAIHPKQLQTTAKVTSQTNLFLENCPTKNVIGVTGTKGKGTTSSLITKLLEAAGYKVWLGGNIGRPLLDSLPSIKADDWVVLEMSSFQLIDLESSPPIGVCLMVVPEHLDVHTDLKEYLWAKQNLFRFQKPEDVAIYNSRNEMSKTVVSVTAGSKQGFDVPPAGTEPAQKEAAYVQGDSVFYKDVELFKTSEVTLRGRHNLENVCAAISATWGIIGNKPDLYAKAVKEFKGLEHRIELVRTLDDVEYYDDSFATTPETTIACLKAFPSKGKVIILGGSDKGVPFDELANQVAVSKVRHAVLIGDTAPVIQQLLASAGFVNVTTGLTEMPKIVEAARSEAQPGDVVLLSTGCASFGLFKDYKDRGDQFKQAVNSLN